MITSLSFTYLQVSPINATGTAAALPAAVAPAPAPQPVARDECRGHCDTPRRSPLLRALKDALMELVPSAKPVADRPASAAAATDTTAAANQTAASNQTSPHADASPDLEDALMAFARTLMQVMRDDFGGRRERAHGNDEGRVHRHHQQHHHQGHRRWGDPAQRVEALAQQVSAPAPAQVHVAPAVVAPVSPSVGDETTVPVNATGAADAVSAPAVPATPVGTSSTVIFVASIQIQQAEESTAQLSPFAGLHQRLVDAFAALQKAMGKPEASGGDALKSDLATFLQALAARLRGEDSATAEAATQPGALLSIAA